MASKKQLTNNQPDVEGDFNDTFEDFNFDEQESGDRKPGSPIKRGVKDALKAHFSRADNYRSYVGKVLPRQYGEVWDDYTQASTAIKDAADSIRKQSKSPLNALAKNLQKKIGANHGRTHKWLKKIEENTDEYKNNPENTAKMRDQATKIAIDDVFSNFQSSQEEAAAAKEEVEGTRFARQYVKLQTQERLLGVMARAADTQLKYMTGVDLPYKRKTLELQYRMAHGITDLVEVTRALAEQQRKQLNDVVKNTSLPDIQKQKLSEGYKQNLRNKFIDSTLGGFGGKDGIGGLISGFTKNISDTLKQTVDTIMMGVDAANIGMEMGMDEFDDNPESRKRRLSSGIAGGVLNFVGPNMAGGLSKRLIRKTPKLTRAVFKGAKKIGYKRDNAHSELLNYANGDFTGKDAWIRDLVGMFAPSKDKDTKVNRVTGRNLLEATHFDHASRRSIVEVIPGYLSRILQEIQITRTGDTKTRPLGFSFEKGKFETASASASSFNSAISKNGQKDNIKGLIAQVERAGTKLSDSDKDQLSRVLISDRRSGRMMTPETLMKENYFTSGKQGTTTDQAKTFSGAFKKVFDGNERNRFTGSAKGTRAAEQFFRGVASTDTDQVNVRAMIQDLVDTGRGDVAMEAGFLNEDGTINEQALYDNVAGMGPKTGNNSAVAAPSLGEVSRNKKQRRRNQRIANSNQRHVNDVRVVPVVNPTQVQLPPVREDSTWANQQLEVLKAHMALTDSFYSRNHEDLDSILKAMKRLSRNKTTPTNNEEETDLDGRTSLFDRFKNWGNSVNNNVAESSKWKGVWNSSVGENIGKAGSLLKTGASKAKELAGSALTNVGILSGKTGNMLSKSRLVGARYAKDFKDGIPRVGDVFISGVKNVSITIKMFEDGVLTDSAGKVITTLVELAESTGDIFDETGKVVLSQADKLNTYVRANGQILTRVWVERLKRGSKKVFDLGSLLGGKAMAIGGKGLGALNVVRKTAMNLAREVFLPPRDVYVSGESAPRLLAIHMRTGRYTNQRDGSVITRPTKINGPVLDSDGVSLLITDADIKQGLVDIEGKPFKTVLQRVGETIRKNSVRTKKLASAALGAIGTGLRTAKNYTGAFFKNGMTGVNALRSTNRNKTKEEINNTGMGGDTVPLLIQIRDILDQRLSRSTDAPRVTVTTDGSSDTSTETKDPFEGVEQQESTPSSTSGGNILGSLGSLAMGGLGKLGGLFKKKRAPELVGPVLPETTKPEPKEETPTKQPSRLSRLFKRAYKAIKPSIVTAGGKVDKRDKDGDGDIDNSAKDIQSKWKNTNDHQNGLANAVKAKNAERVNTIDLITGAIGKAISGLGSVLGSAVDLATGGKGGLLRGGAAIAGKGIGKVAKVGSWGLRAAGGFLGRGIAGIGGRKALMYGAGKAAGVAARFIGKRVIMGGLGVGASILGAPIVGPVLAIGGAIWAAKEIYDMFQDNKDPVSKSDRRLLLKLRFTEYGSSLNDPLAAKRFMQLEAFLEDAVKIEGGKAELDKKSIDTNKLLSIVGVSQSDEDGLNRFLTWFNKRFTPIYLKWMTVSKAAGKNLMALEDMSDTDRLKIVQSVSASAGWDVMSNPFGSDDLRIGSKEINYLREATITILKGKAKALNDKGIPEVIPTPREALNQTFKHFDNLAKDPANAAAEIRRFDQQVMPAILAGASGNQFSKYTSESASRVHSRGLTPLQSLRLRMYGFTSPDYSVVYAIRNLEDALISSTVVDDQGRATYSGDLGVVWKDTAKYFGLSPDNLDAETRWKLWFQQRFLPIYTTFIGQVQFHTGLKTEEGLDKQVSAIKVYAIAQSIAGVSGIWNITTMPRVNEVANSDPKSIADIISTLKEQADKQQVAESNFKPPVKTDGQVKAQTQNSSQTPSRSYDSGDEVRMGRYKATPNTMPDVETEAKGGSSSQSGVKPPPQLGSLMSASGELASGSNGMKYVKAPSAGAIDGLNPEVKRLFLAMAEEYGETTSQNIQVNRGFVTKEEQAAQYAQTPEKAAPPGSSLHEFGLALDINTTDLNRLDKLGLLRKYGFTRPVGGETWHIEPAGIQHDVRGLRDNPDNASKAVAAGVGRGGGGVGATKSGFRFGGRDTEFAIKTRDSQSQEIKPSVGGFAGSIAAQQNSSSGKAMDSSTNPTAQGVGGSLYSSLLTASTKEDAKALVQQAAKGVGVDSNTAMTTVAVESGFRTNAKAGTSSATGLYQFTKGTWGDQMKMHAKAYGIPEGTSSDDPRANAILGAQFIKTNLGKAESAGMPSDVTSAYLLHFLGQAGGRKAGQLPDDANMVAEFPTQANSNKEMFYNTDGSPRTKGQFMDFVKNKLNKAAKDFGISDQLIASSDSGPTQSQPVMTRKSAPSRGDTSRSPIFNSQREQQQTATSPTTPAGESKLLAAMKEGTHIHQQQLDTQNKILEQVTKLVELVSMTNKETTVQPPAPVAEAPQSRAQRAVRQVSPPAYRVTSA